jgi:signal transduction histidine kinase
LSYVPFVHGIGFRMGRNGFPGLIVNVLIVVAALESALEIWLRHDALRAPHSPMWFASPAIALVILPLVGYRRFPFAASLTVWLVAIGLSLVDPRLVLFTISPFIAAIAAAFLLGNLDDTFQARLGLLTVAGGAAVIAYQDPNRQPSALLFVPVLFSVAWLAGFALRQRAAQAEAADLRATLAERERAVAVAEERARIARELHDIVAHSVSVMVLHVGAVRHKLPDTLSEEAAALRGVELAGRTALAEMRRLLGAMRESDDMELAPHPGLAGLDQLVAEVGQAGLPVRLHIDGESVPLPEAIDLSAYRIVQEGLTNALKHANASHAEVTVRYRPDELRIEVRDDGRGAAADDGLGHGLVGVRERVKIYGGEMTAGAASDRGFVLSTRLPLAGS